MEKKTLILVISAVIIIICFVCMMNNKDDRNISKVSENLDLTYNKVADEITGEEYYQLYNKETGEVVQNIVDEASLQIYLDNPDFVGSENEGRHSEEFIEYNENIVDENVINN